MFKDKLKHNKNRFQFLMFSNVFENIQLAVCITASEYTFADQDLQFNQNATIKIQLKTNLPNDAKTRSKKLNYGHFVMFQYLLVLQSLAVIRKQRHVIDTKN